MKPTLRTTTLAALVLGIATGIGAPTFAAPMADGLWDAASAEQTIEKRRKKRVKGGSGCDDAGDIAEHPECR